MTYGTNPPNLPEWQPRTGYNQPPGPGPYKPPQQFYAAQPSTDPGRGLRGPHAAIWITVIVCATVLFVCLLPCIFCGGIGFMGSLLPGTSPTPTFAP